MRMNILEPQQVHNTQTSGLVSAYQRTNITVSGALAVAATGGDLLIGVENYPAYFIVPLTQQPLDMYSGIMSSEEELVEGYRAMAEENVRLAEEFLPAALEEWPMWEA